MAYRLSYAIENCRKLASDLFGVKLGEHSDMQILPRASTSVPDCCIFRVISHYLYAISQGDGLYIHL